MPFLLSPQGRAKPIGVGPIDPLRSEAPDLWRGASALISIGDQGAPANLITGARLTVSGSPLRVATPWGLAHRHGTGTGQGAVIPGYGAIDGDPAGAFLVVFRLRPFGSSKDPIVCIQQGTSTTHLCYLRREADGQLKMFLRGGGVDYWGWTSTGWTSGVLYAALITADATGNRLWRNGRQVVPSYSSGSAASTQWLSSLPLADTWRLAAFYSPTQLTGDVELLHYAHWSRALTTAEAEAVSADPWAMVRPRRTLVAVASGVPVETHSGAAAISGGGVVAAAGAKTAGGAGGSVTGGGDLIATGAKQASGAASVTGGGTVTATGTTAEAHSGATSVSGGGQVQAAGNKASDGVAIVAGGGSIVATGTKGARGAAAVSGGGLVVAAAQKLARGTVYVTGGGTLAAAGINTANAPVPPFRVVLSIIEPRATMSVRDA